MLEEAGKGTKQRLLSSGAQHPVDRWGNAEETLMARLFIKDFEDPAFPSELRLLKIWPRFCFENLLPESF